MLSQTESGFIYFYSPQGASALSHAQARTQETKLLRPLSPTRSGFTWGDGFSSKLDGNSSFFPVHRNISRSSVCVHLVKHRIALILASFEEDGRFPTSRMFYCLLMYVFLLTAECCLPSMLCSG